MQRLHDEAPVAGTNGTAIHETDEFAPKGLSGETLAAIDQLGADAGGAWSEREEDRGAVGRTMFDLPSSEDDTVTVLLPKAEIGRVPSQSLVRIHSMDDGRTYLAVVIKGPFAEPDGLRADAPVVVTTSVRGAVFMPHYHGRVQAELLGEELEGGVVVPHRFRPLPNSRVTVLDAEDTARVLRTGGQLRLGRAVGHDDLPVGVPVELKSVLPRHLGILGTTGGGKSTTVAGMVAGLQAAGSAVILFDTEGEYTQIHEPTEDPPMLSALDRIDREPAGVPGTTVYHLVGRESANPAHPRLRPFSLYFPSLSPYAVMELLELTEAQQERFLKAYDAARLLLDRLGIYPATPEEKAQASLIDDLEEGYPQLTLQRLYDVVEAMAGVAAKAKDDPTPLPRFAAQNPAAKAVWAELTKGNAVPGSVPSWRALQGKLGRILRLRVFDIPRASRIDFAALLRPGSVNIIDLSDLDAPSVRNLAITELLRGIQDAQEDAYQRASAAGRTPTPVEIFIEEAHEFLSAERIRQMPNLFAQVARIARRGRKRWLGLVFVTQLPQHLPDEVLGLLNNWVLHKITDVNVVNGLRKQIGGIDEGLWKRLPSLAPGQAIVSFTSMTRPLLVAIDPAAAKLRMVD